MNPSAIHYKLAAPSLVPSRPRCGIKCDVTRQVAKDLGRLNRAWFQAYSAHSHSTNWPGDEDGQHLYCSAPVDKMNQLVESNCEFISGGCLVVMKKTKSTALMSLHQFFMYNQH